MLYCSNKQPHKQMTRSAMIYFLFTLYPTVSPEVLHLVAMQPGTNNSKVGTEREERGGEGIWHYS